MDSCDVTKTHGLPNSLKFELKIIRARNLTPIPSSSLFVRCYLFTRNSGESVRLNSQEIPSATDPYWDESVSLECRGALGDPTEQLQQQSIVFELRWRNKNSVLRSIMRSKLFGTAEIAWKDVLGSRKGSIDACVGLKMGKGHVFASEKLPLLQVGLKISVSNVVEKVNRREIRLMKLERCGCRDQECNVVDEDVSIAAAVFL